ncbi:gluconate 2-dehydrogenase subunit 3 family protein [Rhodothermus profundi]|uniref:Gluconate 2-dehydrogenase subunit 3 n=1 Tax=Rhodothermus profundi TaxID=633813 RepID=A0A1M6R8I9_9BACT|nr:gluconate 2-dehydrogenase subunit 3 family protein [Rhodothermus profundi]SHK28772.1 Gluconate 2-dehydrogenase subunit 3 [Rhodothermus profundi]
MSDVTRRDALKLLALIAAAPTFSFGCRPEEMRQAQQRQGQTQPGPDYRPQFFTEHEYQTVTVLADWVIPADERSGSASDAGVPAFIDFIMSDPLIPGLGQRQTAIRGGLAWLDYQCLQRYGRPFIACSQEQQQELLDLIAYPEVAPPEMAPGVAFFNSFRDLVASGFWSSKMGMEDLQYMGNTAVAEWKGCPDEVLEHLGLK